MSTRNRREPWFYAGVGRVEEAVRQRDEERRLEAMAQARPWPEGLWDAVNAKLDAMETQAWLARDKWSELVRETVSA